MSFIGRLGGSSRLLESILRRPDSLLLGLFSGSLFFIFNYVFLFSLTAASDPLQYVEPSLNPEFGFPYLDRIFLWLWIRSIAVLPLDPEEVGGVATLLASSITLFFVSWFLARRFNLLSGAFFIILYVLSPTILGVASYTYPMQVLTLVLVITLILMSIAPSFNSSLFVGGFGALILILCKVQGGAFFGLLFIYGVIYSKTIHELCVGGLHALMGVGVAVLLIFIILLILDGVDATLYLFVQYFTDSATTQFAGRAEGGMPPFYSYLLEPTAVLALLGILLPLLGLSQESKVLKLWSLAGICQLVGLMSIYIITQRGGPVISNYFLDVYVIGLMCVSVLIGIAFKSVKKQVYYVVVFLLGLGVYLVYLVNLDYDVNSVYTPLYLLSDGKSIILGGVFWIVSLILIIGFVFKKTMIIFISLFPIFIFALLRGDEGISDSKYRIKYHSGYHEVAQFLGESDYGEKVVWVVMKLNRSTSAVGTYHLKMIYKAFYDNGSKYIFSDQEPKSFDVIVTNIKEIFQRFATNINSSIGSNQKLNTVFQLNELNLDDSVDFKLGGLVGEGTIKKIFIDGSYGLDVTVINPDTTNLIQLDLSNDRLIGVREEKVLFISSDPLKTESSFVVRMFAQYFLNGKWTRETFQAGSSTEVIGLSLVLPEGAMKVSYGWLLNVKKNHFMNASANIILPDIRYSISDTNEDKFGLSVGKVWEIKKQ